MNPIVLLAAAIVGAALGVAADRLSVRWPAHEADYQRRRPDWRTALLALIGAAAAAALMARYDEPRDLAILAIYFGALLLLLATDLDQRILPDLITLPLIPLSAAVLLVGWSPLLGQLELGLVSGIAAGVGAAALLFVTDRVLHGDLGGGDLKLAVSIGLMSGISRLFFGMFVASIGFSVVLLALMAARRLGLKSAVPFGPVLILAAFAAVLVG